MNQELLNAKLLIPNSELLPGGLLISLPSPTPNTKTLIRWGNPSPLMNITQSTGWIVGEEEGPPPGWKAGPSLSAVT